MKKLLFISLFLLAFAAQSQFTLTVSKQAIFDRDTLSGVLSKYLLSGVMAEVSDMETDTTITYYQEKEFNIPTIHVLLLIQQSQHYGYYMRIDNASIFYILPIDSLTAEVPVYFPNSQLLDSSGQVVSQKLWEEYCATRKNQYNFVLKTGYNGEPVFNSSGEIDHFKSHNTKFLYEDLLMYINYFGYNFLTNKAGKEIWKTF